MGACPKLADVVPPSAINGAIPKRNVDGRCQGCPLAGVVEVQAICCSALNPSGSSRPGCLREDACQGQIIIPFIIFDDNDVLDGSPSAQDPKSLPAAAEAGGRREEGSRLKAAVAVAVAVVVSSFSFQPWELISSTRLSSRRGSPTSRLQRS
jgi:hypothetical protein